MNEAAQPPRGCCMHLCASLEIMLFFFFYTDLYYYLLSCASNVIIILLLSRITAHFVINRHKG
uniref:Uncharacterized protein n=1 Tax=Glossina palpalis gambiensis TaxID=67801 RepID=A0A1B0B558_9MUSC